MNISTKFAVLLLVLGLATIMPGLPTVSGTRANQTGSASGRIFLFNADRPVYVPRTTAFFNIEVENDGSTAQDYQLTVVAFGPSGYELPWLSAR